MNRIDSKSFLVSYFFFLKQKFQIISFNIINNYLGFYTYSNIIFNNIKSYISKIENYGFSYILGSDNTENITSDIVVYQGFIKTNLYYNANLIFATTSPYEYDSLYINLEGRFRYIKQVIKSFIGAYND
jgi:hypothetical protein